MPSILYETPQNVSGLITSVTASNPTQQYPIEQLLDYATISLGSVTCQDNGFGADIDLTLSSPVTINCVGFAEHNIIDGAKVSIRRSDFSLITNADPVSGNAPQLLRTNDVVTSDFLKIRIDHPNAPGTGLATQYLIGSLFIGTILDLPRGITAPYTAPPLGRVTESYPLIGQRGGHFLGSYVKRTGWEFTIEQKNVSPQWVEQNWLPFARHAEHRPFFYLWDDTRPGDCVYAWATKITPPRYSSPTLMEFSMQCQGRHLE